MNRRWLLVVAVLAMSSVLWGSDAKDKSNEAPRAKYSAATLSSNSGSGVGVQQIEFDLGRVTTYDYAKCIESCDKQYSDCAKGGDAERVKYCSHQHDQCRKACLEHK